MSLSETKETLAFLLFEYITREYTIEVFKLILNEYVDIKWAGTTKKYYIEKGYAFTKYKDVFKVHIDDVHQGSNVLIKAKCSGCGETYDRRYMAINDMLKNNITGKFFCSDCKPQRIKETILAKQNKGLLKRGNEGYWTFKENIEKEIVNHIETYGSMNNLARINGTLDNAIRDNDHRELYEILTEMGLNFKDYLNVNPDSYASNFDNTKRSIEGFIATENRFPTANEMVKELGIDFRIVTKMGGMNEFRKAIGYNKTDKLVDDSNYKNRSIFEYKVAQYLIHNNIHAKRDDYVFEGTRHTCDFIVEDVDGNKYYIECWGYNEASTNSVAVEYCKKRILKETLYNNYNMKLISIEINDVYQLNNNEFQALLKDKFSIFSNKELKIFKNVEYLDTSQLSNEDLRDIVMKYSVDDNYMPHAIIIQDNEHYSIYRLILSRFGSYINFADYFGKKTYYGKSKVKSA